VDEIKNVMDGERKKVESLEAPRFHTMDSAAGENDERAPSAMENEAERRLLLYSVDGDVRFVSHHDMMRLFARALIRADLPLRYSGGFNPRPKLSIPLPRPVGVASECECIVIELRKSVAEEDLIAKLQRQMPPGLNVLQTRLLPAGERPRVSRVRYQMESPDLSIDPAMRIREIMGVDVLSVLRESPKRRRPVEVNIRPYVDSLSARDGRIEFTLNVTEKGSARPAEIAGLFGFDVGSINHRIRRMEVQWR